MSLYLFSCCRQANDPNMYILVYVYVCTPARVKKQIMAHANYQSLHQHAHAVNNLEAQPVNTSKPAPNRRLLVNTTKATVAHIVMIIYLFLTLSERGQWSVFSKLTEFFALTLKSTCINLILKDAKRQRLSTKDTLSRRYAYKSINFCWTSCTSFFNWT